MFLCGSFFASVFISFELTIASCKLQRGKKGKYLRMSSAFWYDLQPSRVVYVCWQRWQADRAVFSHTFFPSSSSSPHFFCTILKAVIYETQDNILLLTRTSIKKLHHIWKIYIARFFYIKTSQQKCLCLCVYNISGTLYEEKNNINTTLAIFILAR